MDTDQTSALLDDLQSLLEKQVEMVKKSNYRQVEALAIKADSIVDRIVKTSVLGRPEFAGKKDELLRHYKKLQLMIEAGKSSIEKQLKQVGIGKKTLSKYTDRNLL